MNNEYTKKSILDTIVGLTVVALLATLVILGVSKIGNIGGNSAGSVRTSYDVFGSSTASSTPNSLYASSSKVLFAAGLENLHLDIRYTPKSQDSVLFLLVEGSNDGGLNYFPLASKTVGTTEVKLYGEGVSSTPGIPYLIPGDSTSVSGTMLAFMEDIDIVADHIRFSMKESTTSTKGEVYIRATLTTKD